MTRRGVAALALAAGLLSPALGCGIKAPPRPPLPPRAPAGSGAPAAAPGAQEAPPACDACTDRRPTPEERP